MDKKLVKTFSEQRHNHMQSHLQILFLEHTHTASILSSFSKLMSAMAAVSYLTI